MFKPYMAITMLLPSGILQLKQSLQMRPVCSLVDLRNPSEQNFPNWVAYPVDLGLSQSHQELIVKKSHHLICIVRMGYTKAFIIPRTEGTIWRVNHGKYHPKR